MRTEYRIIWTMTFDNPTDRDIWYTASKTSINSLKAGNPAYRASAMTKDDYTVIEPATETI